MRLDPEEQVIAAELEQAELDDANERGAGAWSEFKPEGHAKVTITISRELVECARALEFTTPAETGVPGKPPVLAGGLGGVSRHRQ